MCQIEPRSSRLAIPVLHSRPGSLAGELGGLAAETGFLLVSVERWKELHEHISELRNADATNAGKEGEARARAHSRCGPATTEDQRQDAAHEVQGRARARTTARYRQKSWRTQI